MTTRFPDLSSASTSSRSLLFVNRSNSTLTISRFSPRSSGFDRTHSSMCFRSQMFRLVKLLGSILCASPRFSDTEKITIFSKIHNVCSKRAFLRRLACDCYMVLLQYAKRQSTQVQNLYHRANNQTLLTELAYY